jgi:hypothetical protein
MLGCSLITSNQKSEADSRFAKRQRRSRDLRRSPPARARIYVSALASSRIATAAYPGAVIRLDGLGVGAVHAARVASR